ncbi:MAG: guanylate kinase [Metamycoplasmataceae bacterium]|uniref:guanylate kinase n=1 Tax=Mycoplasmopsis lipophila TaxID=2117 RepID=UPI0038737EC4
MKTNSKPIIIFTGPSGVGKGTIEQLLFTYPELKLMFSCSATTRKPRTGEINGEHYHFISKEEFLKKIDNNEFLEYSFHFDNYYGTLYSEIDKIHAKNGVPFLEIETNGAKQILQKISNNKDYNLITIFVLPPSIDELEKRIIKRNSESEESLKKRIEKAQNELKEAHLFRYRVISDDVERSALEVKSIILKEIDK